MKQLLLLLALLPSTILFAQSGITWQPAIPVAATHYSNFRPRIVTDAKGNAVIIWGKQSAKEVYYARWNDTAFTMPLPLNPNNIPIFTDSWAGPEIASHGDTIYAVYKQTPEDSGHIYTVASYNGAVSFSSPVRVDFTADSLSRFPTVTTDDIGNPIVGFMEFDAGFTDPRFSVAKSTNYGASYGADVTAGGHSGGEACDCCPASLAAAGNNVVLMFRDNFNNIRNMWAGISTDGGLTFPTGLQMDQTDWFVNVCPSSGPDGVIIGDSIYMVFMSQGSGKKLVYLSKASLNSSDPAESLPITGTFTGLMSQNYPRMASAGKALAAVWKQSLMTTDQLALVFNKDITKGLPSIYDTVATGLIINTDVAISDTTVHVVWQDDNADRVMYRKGTFMRDTVTVTGVENEEHIGVSVYPNPGTSSMIITASTTENIRSIAMFDLGGKQLAVSYTVDNKKATINLDNLATGTYILRLQSQNGYVFKKIMRW